MAAEQKSTIDEAEIEHFSSLANQWWDPKGKFRPLHKFNPVRLTYIRENVCAHFGKDMKAKDTLKGLRILDIGCGGGLLSEPIARMGASVTGADPAETNIGVASLHAEQSGLDIDYRATTAEDLAEAGEKFDVVLCMEVVEHVADVALFISACASMVKDNGLLFVATINRTRKAQFLAITMAESVLRWLPKGTHHYEKLVKPEEITTPAEKFGLTLADEVGVSYNPIFDRWALSNDMDVNYMMLMQRPKQT